MRTIQLSKIEHSVKIGDTTPDLEPNITEDSLFVENNEVVGFYIKRVPEKLEKYINIANAELLSDRVPKEEMSRGPNSKWYLEKLKAEGRDIVKQYSTIIGSCAPRPHMKMPYARRSAVHDVATARTFIKAMLLACHEAEEVIRELAPSIYDRQKSIIDENVAEKWRFGRLFTSSISNFNIAASYHRDAGNLVGCVNVIIAKKSHARGGNTTVPDYAATMDSADNSMLVYPAWRNVHGVTPITPLKDGGYRNSLVFYPLKAFNGLS